MDLRPLAAVATLLATPVAAEQIIGPGIAELDVGVICPSITGRVDFAAHTTVVPAELGMGFGVRARATAPQGLTDVAVVIHHPPFPDSAGEDALVYRAAISGQGPSGFFFRFESEEELALGDWSLSALQDGALLYRVDFRVVDPEPGDQLLRTCGLR